MTETWWRRQSIQPTVLLLAVLLAGACRQEPTTPTPTVPMQAELSARALDVRYRLQGSAEETLPITQTRQVGGGDAVGVDGKGEAWLRFGDALLVRLYRDTNLAIEGGVDPDGTVAQRFRLQGGTVFANVTPQDKAKQRVRVSTEWAEIEVTGTEFLVYYEPQSQSTWVVASDGQVKVTAAGQAVMVPAGWQTWVDRGQPPVPPLPATRAAVGNRFPTVDVLTNGAIADSAVLAAPTPAAAPTDTPSPSPTPSATAAPTDTPTPGSTDTATPTPSPTPSPRATDTPTRVPPTVPPQAPPRRLQARLVERGVELFWLGTDEANSYSLERKQGSGAFTFIAELHAETLRFTDNQVEGGFSYTYRVGAVYANQILYSNEVTITTPRVAVCPDPAADQLQFSIVEYRSQFSGSVLIQGAIANRGADPYRSQEGQQAAVLYENDTEVARIDFATLEPAAVNVVEYGREWDASSSAEGEFPPTYQLVLEYGVGIESDGNPNNDDCDLGNNTVKRSGSEINGIFRDQSDAPTPTAPPLVVG